MRLALSRLAYGRDPSSMFVLKIFHNDKILELIMKVSHFREGLPENKLNLHWSSATVTNITCSSPESLIMASW